MPPRPELAHAHTIVAFVKAAMHPVRCTSNRIGFDQMREDLNGVLAFSGLSVGEDGLVSRRTAARTHDEAAVTKRLRDEMLRPAGRRVWS